VKKSKDKVEMAREKGGLAEWLAKPAHGRIRAQQLDSASFYREAVSFTTDKWVIEALGEIAEARHLSPEAYLEFLVREHLQATGNGLFRRTGPPLRAV